MEASLTLVVAVGLAAGISFFLIFSTFGNNFSFYQSRQLTYSERLDIEIQGVKDFYRVNEPISFTIQTKGNSDNLCNYPQATAVIRNSKDAIAVWSSPITFQTTLLCLNIQGIDKEWRFGYANEELPYQSALRPSPYQENNIAIAQPGTYRITAEFDEHKAEKDFQVGSSDEANSVIVNIIDD
jgi:hypothetical protein